MTKFFAPTLLAVAMLAATSSGPAQAFGFGGLFSSMLGQPDGGSMNIDETLLRISEKMNHKMPQSVDPDTRLDKVSAEPGHQLAYHYTMLHVRSKDISTASFYKTFRPTLQKRVCAAKDLKMFFRNRVTLAYAYQGNDGEDIGKLAFTPKDCGYTD